MKKILFIVIPEKGHLNPSIGVAQYLQQLGNEVCFYAAHDISEQLNKAGLPFIGPQTPSSANQGAGFTQRVRDPLWLRQWIKGLLIDQAYEEIDFFCQLVNGFDLVVSDPMIYSAVIACERTNKRWVALSNSLNPVLNNKISSELLDTVEWLRDDREQLFQGCEVKFRGCDALSRDLTIAFTTTELTGGVVEGVHQVGGAKVLGVRGDETDFPWERLDASKPLIYASFGSQVYHQPDYFKKLIQSVRNKEVQLVAAVHDLEFKDVPENVILCGYAPQLSLLEKASVLVTHGGANSVMEALTASVSVLINPICNDQFHQAWFLERAGCGREINLEKVDAHELWGQIAWSLSVDISRVSDSYQVDGSRRAAELIHEL